MFKEQTQIFNTEFKVARSFKEKYYGYPHADGGVVFVMDGVLNIFNTHRFVNRGLEEPIDVLFVAEDGTVTKVESLPAADSTVNELRLWYDSVRGKGQYIVEASDGWADKNNITEGDTIPIDL